jgi:protein TonB
MKTWTLIVAAMLFALILLYCQQAEPVGESLITSTAGQSESPSPAPPPPPPPVEVDTPPRPAEGMQAIGAELKYPDTARKGEVQGRVELRVYVSAEGEITDVTVDKSLDKACDEAAVKAVRSVKWKPGYKDDKPVATNVLVPIEFKLQ